MDECDHLCFGLELEIRKKEYLSYSNCIRNSILLVYLPLVKQNKRIRVQASSNYSARMNDKIFLTKN